MKWLIITFLLLALFVLPIQAQEKVFFPMIISCFDIDNNWRLIKPQGSTNEVLNPSGEIAGNFTGLGLSVVTRETTFQKYGLYSYHIVTTGGNGRIFLNTNSLTNNNHFVTFRIRGTLPAGGLVVHFGVAGNRYLLKFIEKIDTDWDLYGILVQAVDSSGATDVNIRQNGGGSGDFYIDGVQVEAQNKWTTYIDGTQEGCEWDGAAHAATSTRSTESRAGGISQDFWEEYNFNIRRIVAAGTAERNLSIDEFAILPGGELNNIKVQSRRFTIQGKFIAGSEQELHQKRQELETELLETSYVNNQPFRLRFNGAEVQKEIAGHYAGGLEGNLAAFYGNIEVVEDELYMERQFFTEDATIQFDAPNPFWQEVGESAALLDTNDSATFRTVAARLRSTGQWDELGPPNAAGTYADVKAIVEDDIYVYFGGNFTNFDNIANADYIVRWHKIDQVWSALGVGVDNIVRDMVIGPDGTLYATGDFLNAGGAGANRIASWNGAAWSTLGTGFDARGMALVFGLNGLLFAGGFFNTAGGVAVEYVSSWNGSAWADLSSNFNAQVLGLTVGPDGIVYAGGQFTTAGGAPGDRIASYDGSSWSALSTGIGSPAALALDFDQAGLLYVGGDFTTPGNFIANWNGTSWFALGEGTDNTVESISVGQDDIVFASGSFTEAGGITLGDRIARWNGFSWAHLDIDLPGSPFVYDVYASKFADPIVKSKYDLFLGFSTTGTGNFAGLVTIDNDGNAEAFPKIIYTRDGGTSAIIETLKNERTGKELLFDYSLLDGETLTIDLSPTQKSIISNFFGSRLDAVLANSDFGDWALLTRDNDVTSFVNVSGGPTVVGYLLWRDSYNGYD